MKKVNKITGWTDYPFAELGDNISHAPIRHVQVLDYDGDKYIIVGFIDMEPKVGDKVYFHQKVFTDWHYRPHYDAYKGKWFEVTELHLDEETGEYSGHLWLAELVYDFSTQTDEKVPLKYMVHDDEVMVASSMKRGYLYSRPQRFSCVKHAVNGDKIAVAFGYDTIGRYYAKRGIKIKRDRWGFTFR
jgi:hypothetical protein